MYDLRTIMTMNGGRAHALSRADVKAQYGSECGKVAKVANNSWRVDLVIGGVAFVHVKTEVVRILPDGSVILNSGGWKTRTTKDRLNRFQGLGRVYSNRRTWRVRIVPGEYPNDVPFVDGMMIRPDGTVIYLPGVSDEDLRIKTIRQSDLTSDCWNIQAWGLRACRDCEARGTDDCGGKTILAKMAEGTFPETGLPTMRRQ